MNRKKKLLLILVFLILLGSGSGFTLSQYKRDPAFCVSCHLPNGKPLHEPKYKNFTGYPSVDLASRHAEVVSDPNRSFACATCHTGSNLNEQMEVLRLEIVNTGRYFFGTFQEPEKLDHPMGDPNCTGCHTKITAHPNGFHSFKAHQPTLTVRCIECHTIHSEKGEKSYYFIEPAPLLKNCKRCHPGLSVRILEVLPERLRSDITKIDVLEN